MTVLQTVRRIHEIFAPCLKKHKRHVPATYFLERLVASPVTIIRARKALGIESRKIAGQYQWIFPKLLRERKRSRNHEARPAQTPETVLNSAILRLGFKVRPAHKYDRLVKPAEGYLMRRFQSHGYQYPSKEIVQDSRTVKMPRAALFKAKNNLGILSVRQKDRSMHWIYPAQEVCDWLGEKMQEARNVAYDLLMKEAAAKDWSAELMNLVREKVGGIEDIVKDDVLYWHDINYRPDPSSVPSTPLIEEEVL